MRDGEETQALVGLIALFAITAAWWALAFWPIESGPAWLERTRYVCFGVRSNGLPDGGGWIGLIGGPVGMLLILTAGWGRGLARLLKRARRSRTVTAILAALTLGCITLISGATLRVQQARAVTNWQAADRAGPVAAWPRLNREAPALELTAQNGQVIALADFAGRPVLVTFAYAHCSTVCPLLVSQALRAQEELRGSDSQPVVLIVTLDPWRDTPSSLPGLAKTWRLPAVDAWVLGGTVAAVEATLAAWQVPRSRNTITGEVTHPSLLYVVDRDGRIAFAATGGVQAIVSLVRRL